MRLYKWIAKKLMSFSRLRSLKSASLYKFDDYHKILLDGVKNPVIFDVGANEGQSIVRFRKLFPEAVVHSFEPDKKNFSIIAEKYSGPWLHLNNIALGEREEELTFNRTAKTTLSSLNKMNTDTRFSRVKSAEFDTTPAGFTKESYVVPVHTLDKYVPKNGIEKIHLLKVDTQAYEDKVLEGATETLAAKKIDILELEILFEGIYERALTFFDIEKILLPYGYELFSLGNKAGYYPSRFNTVAFQVDAMYVTSELIHRFKDYKLGGIV
jgi:FkbM family methyltransferase